MKNKTCFFIGNRHTPSSIKQQLIDVVERHITEYGVTTFIVGHYGAFDFLVQNVLKELKKKYYNIKLYLLTPYAFNQLKEVPESFDGNYYPEGLETVPRPFAIAQANRLLLKYSDYLIAYSHHIGNTQKFINYAQKREKKGMIKITQL